MSKVRVLLVRTGRIKQAITLGEFMFSEPVGLECLYALLKDRHDVRILDLMVQEEDFLTECRRFAPDIIGFTSLCIDVEGVKELARAAKTINKDYITLVGGSQAVLAPQSFYCEDIDHVFCYTTRGNVSKLFTALEAGSPVGLIDGICSRIHSFRNTGVPGINDYIIPDRSSTARYRKHYSYFGYRPCAIMQTSRGCSSQCRFCLRWRIEGCREQDEPLAEIVAQIETITEPSIMIYDNNFLYNKKRLEEFCGLIDARQIKKNFICYGSAASIVKNEAIMKRLAQNGLAAVLVGYESFRDEDLKSFQKPSTTEINLKAATILKDSGISCWASFILHPDWTKQDFQQFRRYIKRLKPELSSLSPLTPFVGGGIYEEYQDRLLFSPTDYSKWSFSLVSIRPSQMSLRCYYYEVLKTNLYVNLFLNNPRFMVNKFGISTVFRLARGATRFLFTYISLMLKG